MSASIKTLASETNSVLILLPKSPYFDQVAAGLSLGLVLEKEKETQVFCPTPMTVEFNRLVGVDKVVGELGNKNLKISFTDYDANNIERVSYDVDGSECRLTVIPKPDFAPPQKDQVSLSFSGVSSDLVIMIGGANETHFPILSSPEFSKAKLVHIGVHDLALASKQEFVSLSRPGSSISEVVGRIIAEDYKDKLDRDVASNLLTGLHEGSKNFSSQYVSSDTFKLASELMTAGGRRNIKEPLPGLTPPHPAEAEIEKEPTPPWSRLKPSKGTSIS